MSEILNALTAPFPPEIVSWRVGSATKDKKRGMALAYIDARDVMRRLDEVVGPGNWQCDYPWSDGKRVVCRIGIKIDGEWVWKADGAGDTDYEGEKGALSDAFKRAAVKWGIGRYLYDMPAPWVELEHEGRQIAAAEMNKLRAMLTKNAPLPSQRPTASANPPVPPADDLKAQAEELVRKLKEADTLSRLDMLMEDARPLLKLVPEKTYQYIGKLYDTRRTAMETPS